MIQSSEKQQQNTAIMEQLNVTWKETQKLHASVECISQTLTMLKYSVLPRMTSQYSAFWCSMVSLHGSLLRSPWVTCCPPYTCQFTAVQHHIFCHKSCHSNHVDWSSWLARQAIGSDKLSKIVCGQ